MQKPQNKLDAEATGARCEGCGEGVCCVNIHRPVGTYIISCTIILARLTHPVMPVCNVLIYIISKRCFSVNGHTP